MIRFAHTTASTAGGANVGVREIVKRRRARGVGSVDIAELKSIRLFTQVPADRLQELADAASQQRVGLRAPVIEEGEECDALYGLLEGTVEVFSRFDDQETVIDVVPPGAALLLACVMTGLPYAAAARTLSPARIIAIPAVAIRGLFDRDRVFARTVAIELSRSSCRIIEELTSLKTRTSIERLADWLVQADAQADSNGHFKLPCGKRTLASHLGMTPECLSRGLRSLADHGLTVRGRDVTVADRAELAAIIGAVAPATDTDR
jgi:CRP/FNR family transcriptional activator FtrB